MAEKVVRATGTASPANVPGGRTRSVSWIDAGGNLWLCGRTGAITLRDCGPRTGSRT